MTDNNHLGEKRATFNLEGLVSARRAASKDIEKHRAKIFKSGNSLALRLPKALGLKEGTEMVITVENGRYLLEPADAPKRKIDISGFAGKAPWLKELPRYDFEDSPRDWHLLEHHKKRPA